MAAIDSEIIVCGVDILDSKLYGNVVLEINGWPWIPENPTSSLGVDVLDEFARCFISKV
jgi:glutathione synthase/RimK-type ligase-like ATP-grasp enzyme